MSRGARDLTDAYRRRVQVRDRLLDYYQDAAALAGTRLARLSRPRPVTAAFGAFRVPDLEDAGQALTWVRAERANLLACLELVSRSGQHARVVALTGGVAALLMRDGPWAEAVTYHDAAVAAARYLGDRLGETNALCDLGEAWLRLNNYPAAAEVMENALAISRQQVNRLGEANSLRRLGEVRLMTDDYPVAAEFLEEALGIYRDLGDVRLLTGDYPGGTGLVEEGLRMCRDLGDRLGEASALRVLGEVRRLTG